MSLWPCAGEKLLEKGQELAVEAGIHPCAGCGMCLVTAPGGTGLPPDEPETHEVSEDAFEIAPEEW